MGFPETNPQNVSLVIPLPASGVATGEVVLMRTMKMGTITNAWAEVDVAAATASGLELTIYNRGTAFTGTTKICTFGTATAWGATTPKEATVSNNTDIAVASYITGLYTRINASTATAFNLSCGLVFVPGSPAAVGSIG